MEYKNIDKEQKKTSGNPAAGESDNDLSGLLNEDLDKIQGGSCRTCGLVAVA